MMMNNAKKAVLAALVAASAIATVAACDPSETATAGTSGASELTPAPLLQGGEYTARRADEVTPVDVWKDEDGSYRVGSGDQQIPVGTYAYEVRSSTGGYYALCTDIACTPGEGMIDNDFVPSGTGFIEVTADTNYVELQGLTLTVE